MKIGQKILLGLVGVLSLGLFNMATFSQYTYAEGVKNKVCEELANAEDVDESVLQAAGCSGPTGTHKNIAELANTIINVAMSLAGIVAVGALILAGQRYIAAGGDAALCDCVTCDFILGFCNCEVCNHFFEYLDFCVFNGGGRSLILLLLWMLMI